MADFVGLFNADNLDPQQQMRARAMQLAQQDPWTQVNYGRNFGGEMAGAGAAGLIRSGLGALSGADTRTREEKLRAVRNALMAAVKSGKVDPTNREAILALTAQLLMQAGLIDEANQTSKELEALRTGNEESARKDREQLRKENADAARKANMEARIRLMQDAASKPDQLLKEYAKTYEQLEAMDYEDAREKAQLQATLRGLESRLKIKPEKKGNEWRVTVTPSTKNAEGQIIKYNTVTGEHTVEPLNNRVAGGGGDGSGDGASGPNGKPTPLKDSYGRGLLDAEDRAIYVDKNGTQWVSDGEGGWERASSARPNDTDDAMRGKLADKLATSDATIGIIDNILVMMRDVKSKNYLGLKAYANRWMDMADRLQAQGVPLRAQITNLMSQHLHERSGAAVTVQEFDRLRGFLPQPTDSFDVVLGKLRSMRQVSAIETNALRTARKIKPKDYGDALSGGTRVIGGTPAAATAAPKKRVKFGELR